ncbi:MAG TPA: hypothetical protein VF725_13340 [Ktedonobacterales bacterium]
MGKTQLSPEERFAALVDEFAPDPDVTPPAVGGRRPFGASALKARGKVFAMLSGGRLTLKLPAERVAALVASDAGERFDPRHNGRQMREWVCLAPGYMGEWLPLAREARAFVGATR